jgi:hypothetical protein
MAVSSRLHRSTNAGGKLVLSDDPQGFFIFYFLFSIFYLAFGYFRRIRCGSEQRSGEVEGAKLKLKMENYGK